MIKMENFLIKRMQTVFARGYRDQLQEAVRRWKRLVVASMNQQKRQLEITQDIFMDELNQSMEIKKKLDSEEQLDRIRSAKCTNCLTD